MSGVYNAANSPSQERSRQQPVRSDRRFGHGADARRMHSRGKAVPQSSGFFLDLG